MPSHGFSRRHLSSEETYKQKHRIGRYTNKLEQSAPQIHCEKNLINPNNGSVSPTIFDTAAKVCLNQTRLLVSKFTQNSK